MIITEQVQIDGRNLTYTYSDADCYIVRDGISYIDAYDPEELGRVYTEGDPIPAEENGTTAEDILSILLGGETA